MGEAEAILHQHQEQESIPLQAPPSMEETDPPDFSVLRLHSSPPPPSSFHRRRHSPCSSCGCSHSHTRKRRLPLRDNHNPAKKLFLDTPPPHKLAGAGDFFPLRRTVSDATSPSPASASNSSLPPLPPSSLRRCTSDPIPIPALPPTHSKPLSTSSAHKTGDSYISKRNKMLSSWREFNQWMEKEFTAGEEEETPKPIPREKEEDVNEEEEEVGGVIRLGSQEEFEESLSVEKDGDRLNIHFRCHCGNAYHFLLADGNCYYKLI